MSTVLLAVTKGGSGFSEQYARAREAAGYAHADDVLDIVDKLARGELDPQQARVMIDGRKWAAERMAPKAHSPRQNLDHTTNGKDLAAPAFGTLYGTKEEDA